MKLDTILVLHKTSLYEHYHDRSTDMCRGSNAQPLKQTHDTHYLCLEAVCDVLQSNGLKFDVQARGQLSDYSRYDMVITIGGDGTFFEAARYVDDQILLGVNSDPEWSVGRFCATTRNEFADFFHALLVGEKKAEALARLTCMFSEDHNAIPFINDILVTHQEPAGLSRYRLSIGGHTEEQRGSGLWISTAAGSSGAIHSAGGNVMPHQSFDFQYMPRELYTGWRNDPYVFTGGILNDDEEINICSLMPNGMVYIDGAHVRVDFPVSVNLKIKLSDKPFQVLMS